MNVIDLELELAGLLWSRQLSQKVFGKNGPYKIQIVRECCYSL